MISVFHYIDLQNNKTVYARTLLSTCYRQPALGVIAPPTDADLNGGEIIKGDKSITA